MTGRRRRRRWRSTRRCSPPVLMCTRPGSTIPVPGKEAGSRRCAAGGGWRKGTRHEDRDYLPLTSAVLAAHLKGEIHIGLYPLLDGDKCWWLAADFDGPE